MKAIVQAGTPSLTYGVLIGFSNDSDETLSRLEENLWQLYKDILAINPSVNFHVTPLAIVPIPGTRQNTHLRQSGLPRFDEPSISGGMFTPSVDTRYLSYKEIFNWQIRLVAHSS